MPSEEIFTQLAKDLSILRGEAENIDAWRRRLIYSALGKLALASVWDDEGLPSLQHFSATITERQPYYLQILDACADYLGDLSLLRDEIYAIYLNAGAFYHKANHLSPATSVSAPGGAINFLRGCNPLSAFPMSGLGEYAVHPVVTQRYYHSAVEMFRLHRPFISLVTECEKAAIWENANFPKNSEFLTMQEQRKFGYWQPEPNRTIAFGLMRVPLEFDYHYFLYRKVSDCWQWCQLPIWQTNPHNNTKVMPEWLALANGILMLNHLLPPVHCVGDVNLVTVSFPYLLPPAEETFFKLYSWPMPDSTLNEFSQRIMRQMARPVYQSFTSVMESLGYLFEEET